MKTILLALTISGYAYAAQYQQFYTNAKGTKVTQDQAIVLSLKGDSVFKCTSVEMRAAKPSLKTIAKPKKAAKIKIPKHFPKECIDEVTGKFDPDIGDDTLDCGNLGGAR